jgi:hypothetical protein
LVMILRPDRTKTNAKSMAIRPTTIAFFMSDAWIRR